MVESDGVLPNNNQTHKKIKYLILGCGSIGYNVLEELKEDDENVLVIDVNEKRVEDNVWRICVTTVIRQW